MSVTNDTYKFRYEIYKMSVKGRSRKSEYKNKLEFWRELEKRYSEQKQRWLGANAEMRAARHAAEKARQALEASNQKKVVDEVKTASDVNDESYDVYEEFSDVDQQSFADPAAQYYSSLNAAAMHKIKADLTLIHRRAENAHQTITQQLVWTFNLFFIAFCVACFFFVKVLTTPKYYPEAQPCPGCKQEIDVPIRGLINALFPQANEMDEV